jgi:Glycosyl hydrolases family 16.
MIDLIKPALWKYATDGGNIVNKGTSWAARMDPLEVQFVNGGIYCTVTKKATQGWDRDANWQVQYHDVNYAIGHMISKEQFFYGSYELVCTLPNFRGAWPAFWFVDWSGKLGMPPEIDVFEKMQKNRWLDRYKLTMSYHDGPTYEDDHEVVKSAWSCKPWDCKPVKFTFDWNIAFMEWYVNDHSIMTVYRSEMSKYPNGPMNIIIGNGVADFRGKPALVKPDPFIIHSLKYYPSYEK